MPRTCTVCQHERRRRIDTAIVLGTSNRAIASQFRLTRAAVQRHKRHVAAALERASEKREISIGENILDRLEDLYQRGLRSLNLAEKTKSHRAICGYLRELRGILSGLYEVSVIVAPKPSVRPLPPDYVGAIRRALGMHGHLIPLGVLPGNGSGNGHSAIDLDVLPQD
jgi:hypothetical protein